MVRKINGEKVTGYYGRVITNGTKTFEEILKYSVKGSTSDYREAKMAVELLIDGIVENIKQGYIIDLGPIGKLYPSVTGPWEIDPDDLRLNNLRGKVVYGPADDILGAVKAATLQWASAKDENKPTTEEEAGTGEEENITPSNNNQSQENESVTMPEISGTTPFAESTTVTIQGPQGAALYYTIDGSTPTVESTEYSEPIVLTDTATVKAFAILNSVISEVAVKTFTKESNNGGEEGDQN